MDKALSGIIGLVFAMVMLGFVAGMAQAATPPIQYTCPICGQKFGSQADLDEHISIIHPAPLGYSCPYCPTTFDTLDELVRHVASEHPDEAPILPIDIIWE